MSKAKPNNAVYIDGDTADRITSHALKEYRANLKSELAKWKKNPRTEDNPSGYWLHPEDVTGNIKTIAALDLIISHYVVTEDIVK